MPPTSPYPPDAARPAPLRAARLVALGTGASHLILAAPVTIGREPSCTIRLDSEAVSRTHAYVLRTPQGYLLVDSSLHGTYVNGSRVQAQCMLDDGDVVDVGEHSFRLELDRRDLDALVDAEERRALPETSQHAGRIPRGRATGKVGLAVALDDPRAPGSRLATWIRRYGLSEVFGIAMAFAGSWLALGSTGSQLAAAYGASIGEALGFYGSLVAREMIQEAYAAGARRAPYGWRQVAGTWRGLLLEFGPAELLDTGLLRPLAMGLGQRLFGLGIGIVAGKLLADIAFYLPVIYTYERRRRTAGLTATRPPDLPS